MDQLNTFERAMNALVAGDNSAAAETILHGFPHNPIARIRREYTTGQRMQVFSRDAFVDRYSGNRLLFPGASRVLSLVLPNEFPYQAHWKTDETHMAYWYYYPTVDHVTPIARGGTNSDDNLVTTSQLRNSAKSHWTVDELGWALCPPGDLDSWDGLLSQTIEYVNSDESLLDDSVLRKWYEAAI